MSLISEFSGNEGSYMCLLRAPTVGDDVYNMILAVEQDATATPGHFSGAALYVDLHRYNDAGTEYADIRTMLIVGDYSRYVILGSAEREWDDDWHLITVTWKRNGGDNKTYVNLYIDDALIDSGNAGGDEWPTAYTVRSIYSNKETAGLYAAEGWIEGGGFDICHVCFWDTELALGDIENVYDVFSAADKCSVTFDVGATSVRAYFANPTNTPVYVTKLQIRGKRIRQYRPSTTEKAYLESVAQGELSINVDLIYQQDVLVGKASATYLANILNLPETDIESATFTANGNEALMTAALELEPGDRIALEETQTGIARDFFINGAEYLIYDNDVIDCTWFLTPAYDALSWRIGIPGQSEIGETTYIVF